MPDERDMDQSKTFGDISSLDELNRVNDAQKATFAALLAAEGDALSERRQSAYLIRWLEGLAHVGYDTTLLDIGGGWPVGRVWATVILAHRTNYHLLDIDGAIIADARRRLPEYGLPAGNANIGINTVLPYEANMFDVVFSSHCLEHSPNLPQTLSEIFRVLKPNGKLVFAVPFGFDDSDEHLICLDVDNWIAATEMAGFDVLNYHLGKTYVMAGWDPFVLAQRKSEQPDTQALRALTSRYTKAGRTFVAPGSSLFQYSGNIVESGSHRVLNGAGSAVIVTPPRPVDGVLFLRHNFSGVVEITAGQQSQLCDLYSHIPYVQLVATADAASEVKVRVIGRSRGSEQAVLHGVLLAPSA